MLWAWLLTTASSTALDAVSLGYETWLIEDGCRGVEVALGDIERALGEMAVAGVHVVKSQDLD